MMFLVVVEFVRHCLGNENFVSMRVPAGAPELVERVDAFVKSLVSAVKNL